MTVILMLLVSIALTIVQANAWIIIPDICIYAAYIATGVLVLIRIWTYVSVMRDRKKVMRRMRF